MSTSERPTFIPPEKLQQTKGRIREILYGADLYKYKGRVSKLQGLMVEAVRKMIEIASKLFESLLAI